MESGTRLGPYEILEQLGAGGMGQVWLAQDTQLGRRVAIKVLPGAFAQDPERLARFEQEARALAALNHPNIAQVFGLERSDGAPVIVMELVEGRDLAQVLAAGALPFDAALAIGRQIAAALGAAHDCGIVHRDLKPANVLVREDGAVKVLDFGLAKAADGAGLSGSGLTESPTIMSPAMTATEVIMGTAAYMAPEQAKGRRVDRRADVWAFGCVLYEMIVGTRPFGGDDVAEMMASVLKDEADIAALPAATPASIRRLLERCFRKSPEERLDSMAAVRLEIDDADSSAPAYRVPAATRTRASVLLAAVSTGLVLGALLWSVLGPDRNVTSADAGGESRVRRSVIPLPGLSLHNRGDTVAISHDGALVALSATRGGQPRLYLRRLDSLEMEEVANSEGAEFPFFSPDDAYVGFFAGGELRKVSLQGGSLGVTVVCDVPVPGAGAWGESGWIYFTFGETRLARVHADGGTPEELPDIGGVSALAALPGGRGMLITEGFTETPTIRKDTATIAVLSADGNTLTPVFEGGYNPRYLSSGHLVFMRGTGLFMIPFDLEAMAVSPPAVSIRPGIWTDSIWAHARYDVSPDGTFVYLPGGDFARTIPTWVDLETGEEEPLPVPDNIYNNFDLSPDGTQLAIQHGSGSQDQVYVYDSRRESFARLTLAGANTYPVWSSDGSEVFFASNREGNGYRLYRKPVDGSVPASRILTDEQEGLFQSPAAWPQSASPDGQDLLVMTWGAASQGADMWKVRLDGSTAPEPILATRSNEIIPQISPDGKWVAYGTDRGGPYRIVIRPYPDVGRREWVVSGDNGFDPRWSPNGDSLLYRHDAFGLMRVPIALGDELVPGVSEPLLDIVAHDSSGSSFAVSADGKRVLVNRPLEGVPAVGTPLVLVTGWGAEVARATGSGSN